MSGSLLTPHLRPAPASLPPLAGAGSRRSSFYSDGAEPRLLRVVTKPGLRERLPCPGQPTVFAHVEKKRKFLYSLQVNLCKKFFFVENGCLAQSKGHAVHNPQQKLKMDDVY
ncbi:E3 ubiquitin-protein ligase RNF182 isoform X2 [Oenanthe melanoleuca]|uniref:E3 ubiquitin-protein ligase RNF182 isoform X2 n=1 Tax=Oenanthe melanoleuca TaxID=2939378 RepID=UPI0024C13F14|nr:E3 ubiquitin-protein ligase RNF182 isoform X2 [Oenanthe melanoleuca]